METQHPATAQEAAWLQDPTLPQRSRYWDGSRWTRHVSINGEQYEEPYLGPNELRWQYGVVNVGMFNSAERMQAVLAAAGEEGWKLITVYDKSSNWFADMEKGFMLFRRSVPPGVRLADEEWCILLSAAG